MPRTLVAIPALNEEATVASVIADVQLAVPWADILVIDDGSGDQTALAARQAGARVVSLPFTVGVGGAMRTAFLHARRSGYDAVVQVDGDGQHVAQHIPDLLVALRQSSVVVGTRFRGGHYAISGPRLWAIRMLASALTRVCGVTLTDTTSGFRAADRRAIALFAEHYPAEYLGDTVESLVIAARAGLVISEVQVRMRPRQGGSASHPPARATLYLGRAVLALYAALSRRDIRLEPEHSPWDRRPVRVP